MVCILDRHLDLTTLTNQILRCCLLTIQLISNIHAYRQILVCLTLIINILITGIPCQGITALCELLITLNILNIRQIRYILYGSVNAGVFQPVRYYNILYLTCRICIDIYGFLLGYILLIQSA